MMMSTTKYSLIITALKALWIIVASQNQTCRVGNDPTSLLSTGEDFSPFAISSRTLLLDFNSSSQCSGRMNMWRFCYYFGAGGDDEFIGIWRRNGSIYELRNDSVLTLRDATNRFELVDFICVRHVVDKPFEVLQNDVIGVVISSNVTASSLVGPATNTTLWMTEQQNFQTVEFNDTTEYLGSYQLHIEANFAEYSRATKEMSVTAIDSTATDLEHSDQELWPIVVTSILSLIIVAVSFTSFIMCWKLARKQAGKHNTTIEKPVELVMSQELEQEHNLKAVDKDQHSPTSSSTTGGHPSPSQDAIENRHVFSYPPPDKRAPLPPEKSPPQPPKNSQNKPKASMGEIYQNSGLSSHQLSNSPLPLPPSPPNVFDVTYTPSPSQDDTLLDQRAPNLSPDACNVVAPLQSTSLPVGVGEAFGDNNLCEDLSGSLKTASKHSYVNVKKTEVSRLQSAPISGEPMYAEPITIPRRSRVNTDQVQRKPVTKPPLARTERFNTTSKISAATIIKNSLAHSIEDRTGDSLSVSLNKIVEAEEEEKSLPNGSKGQGENTAPELYLEPVKTKSK